MDELEKLLETRDVDLAVDPEAAPSTRAQERMTESILRQDVVAPNIVKFTPTYNTSRKLRRVVAGVVAVALSVMGLYRFSRVMFIFSTEAKLDIETSMTATTGQNETLSDQSN